MLYQLSYTRVFLRRQAGTAVKCSASRPSSYRRTAFPPDRRMVGVGFEPT